MRQEENKVRFTNQKKYVQAPGRNILEKLHAIWRKLLSRKHETPETIFWKKKKTFALSYKNKYRWRSEVGGSHCNRWAESVHPLSSTRCTHTSKRGARALAVMRKRRMLWEWDCERRRKNWGEREMREIEKKERQESEEQVAMQHQREKKSTIEETSSVSSSTDISCVQINQIKIQTVFDCFRRHRAKLIVFNSGQVKKKCVETKKKVMNFICYNSTMILTTSQYSAETESYIISEWHCKRMHIHQFPHWMKKHQVFR